MRIKILALFMSIIFIAIGCNKNNGPTRIAITVVMADQSPVSNSSIALLTDAHPIYSNVIKASSGADGKLYFDVTAGQTYYLYHYTDGKVITDPDATYILSGTFTSTAEINGSPQQTPAATIGGPKFVDVNGDGIINKFDLVKKVSGLSEGQTVSVNFIIGP